MYRYAFLLLAFLEGTHIHAQGISRWDVGVITGIQRSFYGNQDETSLGFEFTPKNELVNGLMVNYVVSPYFHVEANLLHSKKEFEFSNKNLNETNILTKQSYLGLPLMLKSGFGKKIKVSIISGVSYEVALGHTLETDDGQSSKDLKSSDIYSSVTEIQSVPNGNQLYVNAGLGLRLPIENYFHFYTSTRYAKSLTPVYANGNGSYQNLIVLFGITANI